MSNDTGFAWSDKLRYYDLQAGWSGIKCLARLARSPTGVPRDFKILKSLPFTQLLFERTILEGSHFTNLSSVVSDGSVTI